MNKEDFIRYMSTPPTQHLSTVELEKLFRLFDNDGDGAITKGNIFKLSTFSQSTFVFLPELNVYELPSYALWMFSSLRI